LRTASSQPEEVRNLIFAAIATRDDWSLALLDEVDHGRIAMEVIPLTSVRKVLLHRNTQIAELVKKHWGSVEGATTEQMQAQIDRLNDVIGGAAGNPYKGKAMFMETCGKCHTLYEDGGKIGPDLTSYKRDDLRNMLINIINPSIEIREGFENFVVITADGRTLNGFVEDQDNRVVVLKTAEGQRLVIDREQIDEMAAIPRSVMPEGQLDKLDDQQIRDLFAYLRSTQPLP
jgi:putative heme-binding domain-containing protein